ncbi:MAG: acyl carrier protein [Xanthobacteraceae bacterium]|nr:acyl carrier protein [Xanthobacteraceae bacterium]
MSTAAMDSEAIYQKLNRIFQDVFDDDSLTVKPQTNAADIPDWDSVNHIRLIVSIESAFKVRFAVNEIEELKDVGDLVKLLQTKA